MSKTEGCGRCVICGKTIWTLEELDKSVDSCLFDKQVHKKCSEKLSRERSLREVAEYEAEQKRTERRCSRCGAPHHNNATLCTDCFNREFHPGLLEQREWERQHGFR
jgi:ribosomal protein S14